MTEGADSQAEDEPAEDEAVWQELQEAQQLLEESAESEELVKNDSAIVYEADLTEAELQTLEQSGAEIYVEENVELSGAGSKAKEKVKGSKEEEPKKSDAKKSDAKKSNAKKSDAKKTNIKKADTRKADTKKNDNKETDAQTAGNHTQDGNVCSGSDEEAQTETEWNIGMIHGDAGSEPSGEPVKVAIMDSGIELLSGIPVEGMVNLVKSEQDIPYYMNDMAGHGTSVADIVSHIAPDAQIYCVKVMDGNNRATLSSVIEGIYWCIDHDIDIINMSFGTDVESRVLHKAIQDAADAGILIVASAGNGNLAGVEYPAAFAEVIAVGAVDTSAQKTAESAVGEEVELAAPGEQILATSLLGLETVVSGTSMAAPHVTGAAAVLWQKDKTKRVDFIRGLLRESANDLGDENEYGSGLIDLQFALEHYDEYATAYEKRQAELSQAVEMQEEQTSEEQAQEAQKEQGAGEMQEEKGLSAIASIEEFDADVQLLEERNHTPIETHEEVAYVEGRWKQDDHKRLVDLANKKYGVNFDGYIIEIFKKGMVAPDASDNTLKVSDDGNNNCWHGGALNYISNYRFATKIARCGGNAAQCKMARGQTEKSFEQMVRQVTTQKVGSKTYAQLFSGITDDKNRSYDKLSAAEKKKWRQLFLYGVAAHILSDTFAHSAYKKIGKDQYISFKKLEKPHSEDDPAVCVNRYTDAQRGVAQTLYHYINLDIGDELDFAPSMEYWGKSRGYYLRKVLSCAKKAQYYHTEKEIESAYKAINCVP